MNKKQKKMLVRIILAAVMLVALSFAPVTPSTMAPTVATAIRKFSSNTWRFLMPFPALIRMS